MNDKISKDADFVESRFPDVEIDRERVLVVDANEPPATARALDFPNAMIEEMSEGIARYVRAHGVLGISSGKKRKREGVFAMMVRLGAEPNPELGA